MNRQLLSRGFRCKYQPKSLMLLGITAMLSMPFSANAKVDANSKVDIKAKVETEGSRMICKTDKSKLQKQALSEQWGIELVAMRSTAAGHMVDFRYKVLDADKAAPLFKRKTKPYLIHQSSGKALSVPNTAKIGSLRNSNTPQNGRTYWMFFGNHQHLIQKGDMVTVAIGDFRAIDIEVQ